MKKNKSSYNLQFKQVLNLKDVKLVKFITWFNAMCYHDMCLCLWYLVYISIYIIGLWKSYF